MSTLLYNPYIVKWSTKGEGGGEKVQKTVYVIYERPLIVLGFLFWKLSIDLGWGMVRRVHLSTIFDFYGGKNSISNISSSNSHFTSSMHFSLNQMRKEFF